MLIPCKISFIWKPWLITFPLSNAAASGTCKIAKAGQEEDYNEAINPSQRD